MQQIIPEYIQQSRASLNKLQLGSIVYRLGSAEPLRIIGEAESSSKPYGVVYNPDDVNPSYKYWLLEYLFHPDRPLNRISKGMELNTRIDSVFGGIWFWEYTLDPVAWQKSEIQRHINQTPTVEQAQQAVQSRAAVAGAEYDPTADLQKREKATAELMELMGVTAEELVLMQQRDSDLTMRDVVEPYSCLPSALGSGMITVKPDIIL